MPDRGSLRSALAALTLLCWTIGAAAADTARSKNGEPPAFPGAVGWAASTPGGRGGRVLKVTRLDGSGPGSLRAVLNTPGPRIIVFEVGSVIDLERTTLKLEEPFVTIAGQTAPSPGITLIRGGMDIATHDVIIRHIRIRPGGAGAEPPTGWGEGGWGEDGISTASARNVIVDHCSLTWATDENLSASGPRFTGELPEDWRRGTSHRITFSHNIIAEGLANSTHNKFEHSKGSLIHDNATDILIYGNLYANNFERNPMFKGGAHGVVVNNFIYNPGQRGVHYNLMALEWGDVPFERGRMSVAGNVLRAGPSTEPPLAFMMLGGHGDLEYYGRDNLAVDRIGQPIPQVGRYTTGPARLIAVDDPPEWWPDLAVRPSAEVERWVLENAGARPWDRDAHDVRVLADAAEGRGKIIDNEGEVGGYPDPSPTRRAFDPEQWDLETMMPKTEDALDSAASNRGT